MYALFPHGWLHFWGAMSDNQNTAWLLKQKQIPIFIFIMAERQQGFNPSTSFLKEPVWNLGPNHKPW